MPPLHCLVGSLVVLASVAGGLLLAGGHLSSVEQLTAFLMIFPASAGWVLASFPMGIHRLAFRAFTRNEPIDEKTKMVATAYFDTMGDSMVGAGIIGSLIGLIHVMNNLDNPDAIGPGIAVAFVGPLYAVLGNVCGTHLASHIVQSRLVAHEDDQTGRQLDLTACHEGLAAGWSRASFGAIFALGSIIGGMLLEGGHLSSILQVTSFIIVLGGTAIAFWGGTKRVGVAKAILSFGKNPAGDPIEMALIQERLLTMRTGTLLSGGVGGILGLIHVMNNLDNPDAIGPGIAVASVAILYGVVGAGLMTLVYNNLWLAHVCVSSKPAPYQKWRKSSYGTFITITVLLFAVFVPRLSGQGPPTARQRKPPRPVPKTARRRKVASHNARVGISRRRLFRPLFRRQIRPCRPHWLPPATPSN